MCVCGNVSRCTSRSGGSLRHCFVSREACCASKPAAGKDICLATLRCYVHALTAPDRSAVVRRYDASSVMALSGVPVGPSASSCAGGHWWRVRDKEPSLAVASKEPANRLRNAPSVSREWMVPRRDPSPHAPNNLGCLKEPRRQRHGIRAVTHGHGVILVGYLQRCIVRHLLYSIWYPHHSHLQSERATHDCWLQHLTCSRRSNKFGSYL